jgi:hypothetical protein
MQRVDKRLRRCLVILVCTRVKAENQEQRKATQGHVETRLALCVLCTAKSKRESISLTCMFGGKYLSSPSTLVDFWNTSKWAH